MDNGNEAPVIPSGTNMKGGVAYDPLIASYQKNDGQAENLPSNGQSAEDRQNQVVKGPTGITFEELAAKKGFKSVDDMAASYANLESQKTKVEMSMSELINSRIESPEPETPIVEPVNSQEDAIKAVERIVKKATRPLEDKLALQELFHNNPDARDYAGEMAKIVKENPGVTWAVAYRAAKFDALQTTEREKGRQEAYQTIQQKEHATTGTPTASNREQTDVLNIVRDKSIPFSEVQKVMKERFRQ